ncbi:MAG: glycosyltransferase [Patescibacteria group bacterium]
MNKKVKVSVLFPVYNGKKYLKDSIKSILNQTFKDFEFLIIDDGSTDNSVKLIKNFNDCRIILIKNNENIGLIKTLNKGLNLAKGEYIIRMDQDDISLPERFFKQLNFMDSNPDCGVCGSWIRIFGDSKDQIVKYETDSDLIKAQLLFFNPLAHSSTILRKAIFDKFSLRYDEFYKNAEDYELWTRVVNCSKICNIPEVFLNYRISQEQITQKYQDAQNKMVMLIRAKALRTLKIDFNDDNLFIHQNLGIYNSPPTIEFINKAGDWLLKIRGINLEKNIYSDKNLSKVIGVVYYNLLIKNIKLGSVVLKKLLFFKLSNGILRRHPSRVVGHEARDVNRRGCHLGNG